MNVSIFGSIFFLDTIRGCAELQLSWLPHNSRSGWTSTLANLNNYWRW